MTNKTALNYAQLIDSANAYKLGLKGEVDFNMARRMYIMCAKSRNRKVASIGQYNLGVFYYYGVGVKKDEKRAFECFIKSVFLYQNNYALLKLGDMYRYGHFVSKDEATAVKLYLKANERKNDENNGF